MLIHTMVALFTTLLLVAPAPAQTTPKSGTFASLSPGNQKIARALHEAQTTPATSSKLTLDQIARMKQEGQGWGNVFRAMKAEGRVDAWNLGAVVSASKHQASTPVAASATSGVNGSASTKTVGSGRVATATVSTGAGPAKATAVGTAKGQVRPGK
jgi:hypothetical protein